ncbi:MAG: MotA/TolQ/ExbB proton channel family protein [Candidatus Binatia bacterium]|nr:MotA/TolQ/ExbB proton channel family protein [Candidatus Binatia bacterium]
MQFTWQELWQHMGVPALLVAGTLLVMGFASLAVFFERVLMLAWSRAATRRFLLGISRLRSSGDLAGIAQKSKGFPRSFLARVIGVGVETYLHAIEHHAGGLAPLEKTQRHMERYLEQIGAELRRGFTVLAAVGSIAPFVGLLGTVVGIISAFQGIADTGSGGLSAVAGGISEALVETALGLTVAIPAVLAYQFLSAKANAEEMALKNAVGELLDQIEDWEESGKLAPIVEGKPTAAHANEVGPANGTPKLVIGMAGGAA